MKHLLTSWILLIIITSQTSVIAQHFHFGLQTGFDLSKTHVVGNKEYIKDKKVYYPFKSFNVNGFISYKSNSFLGLSIEPGFIKKGGVRHNLSLRSGTVLFAPQDVEQVSNFIQIPLFLDFYITKRVFISFGPEFDFLLSSKVNSRLISFYDFDEHEDFDLSGGARLTFNLTKKLDFGILYNHSITRSSYLRIVDDFFNVIAFSKEYNQYLQLLLRYKFN